MTKGIILAGGSGSRLFPLTFSVTKQLLPIYDKPMIYYPLSNLLELGIDNILIISTDHDKPLFEKLLGDGSDLGVKISYKTQNKPNGIAEGLIIGEKFIDGDPFVFILGDNLFVGSFAKKLFKKRLFCKSGATIFTYSVKDPERYGVITLDDDDNPVEIVEKPKFSLSNHAITGLYFYDASACEIAKNLMPSSRNELEITDVNKFYLKKNMLSVIQLNDELTWLDAGTVSALYEASNFIAALEIRTGSKIGCIEEIAYSKNKINLKELTLTRKKYGSSEYGLYLQKLINSIS